MGLGSPFVRIFARFWRLADAAFAPRECGQGISAHCRRHLERLNCDERSFPFEIALENIAVRCDLLTEEAALIPDGLELQRRIVALAGRFEAARKATQEMLGSPASRLCNGILAQAYADRASRVRVDFRSDQNFFTVHALVNGIWQETFQVPSSLKQPLRGALARLEGIGMEPSRLSAKGGEHLPPKIRVVLAEEDMLELDWGEAPS